MNKLNNKYLIGSWIQIGNPEIIEMIIKSGFDFLVIDMEHGSISESDLPGIFNVFNKSDCIPFVRVAKNDDILIRRALDLGARGIIVPSVNSKLDVQKAENAIFYPPKGNRGIGFSKANEYGINFKDYFNQSNSETIFVIQIENEAAVKKIDEIFSSNNIDAYIIGPYDLSGSMGIVGEFDNPKFLENLHKIKQSAINNKIKSGIHLVDPISDNAIKAIKDGYDFIAFSTDALMIYNAFNKDLKRIKSETS